MEKGAELHLMQHSVRWVNYARQDWTAYLAAGDADLASSRDSPKEPGEQDTTA